MVRLLHASMMFMTWVYIINNHRFPELDHHTNLPNLCADVFWSYNHLNRTLFVNFEAAAPPANSGWSSWIAWGLNPTGSGLISVSVDTQRSIRVDEIGTESFWGDIVRLNGSYETGLMKLEAEIVLPEKIEIVDYVMMRGDLFIDGKPDVREARLASFDQLDLSTPKNISKFSTMMDKYSEVLILKKGCSIGRKWSWDRYLTLHNHNVVYNYSLLVLLLPDFGVDGKGVIISKVLYTSMLGILLGIMAIFLEIKANGEFCINFLACSPCCFFKS